MRFLELVRVFEAMEGTASRLRLTGKLAALYYSSKPSDARHITYLCQGILLPEFAGVQLGIGDKLAEMAISKVSGKSIAQIEDIYRKEGDLGTAAEMLLEKKAQSTLLSEELTTKKVYSNFHKIATSSGQGSQDLKINLLSELLSNASPLEAKHIVRFVQGSLRLGAGESTILDALAIYQIAMVIGDAAELIVGNEKIQIGNCTPIFNREEEKKGEASSIGIEFMGKFGIGDGIKKGEALELVSKGGKVRGELISFEQKGATNSLVIQILAEKRAYREIFERAYNMRSDLGEVAETVCAGKGADLKKIGPRVFSPIRPALAERLLTPAQIIEKLGKCSVEGKYDGLRLQIHKKGREVNIFSRKQEPMTHMFPEILDAVKKEFSAKEAIFEGEAIAYDEHQKRFSPFQVTIQRKRKHGIGEMAAQIPLRLYAFELLFADGEDYTGKPYEERRRALEGLISADSDTLMLAQRVIVDSPQKLSAFFEKCLQDGLEGIIAKDQGAPYAAGARKFAWIKLKRSYGKSVDTFDVVIIGYYFGKGKRAQFEFGGVLTAIYDSESRKFKSIAKVGTGFSEEQMEEFSKSLEKIALKDKPPDVESEMTPDVWVQPKIVIEVNADEISKSPTHTAGRMAGSEEGFALRFPRMISLRKDKRPQEATTETEIFEMYELQGQK